MSTVLDIISKQVLTFDARVIVGIDGKDGSGKTTFADALANRMKDCTDRQIIRVSLDDFFNPRSIRRQNSDKVLGNYNDTFDYLSITKNLLIPFHNTGDYTTKTFDYMTDISITVKMNHATNDAIMIVDGVFLQKEQISRYWDYTILIEVDDQTAIERGARRDAKRIGSYKEAREAFTNRYIASQKIYYSECEPVKYSDIVIDNSDYENPEIISTFNGN